MADADQSVMAYMGRKNIVYINVANKLSVDCDCDSNPHDPEMADIGIVASVDPVAIDQACVDAVYASPDPGKAALTERMESRHGIHTVGAAAELNLWAAGNIPSFHWIEHWEEHAMTIGQVSQKYHISADTPRYYERIGLIPPVPRSPSGVRDYDEASCGWVELMKCMRAAGVEIETLVEYVKLFEQGDETLEARKAALDWPERANPGAHGRYAKIPRSIE